MLPNKAMQADERRSGARGSRSKTLDGWIMRVSDHQPPPHDGASIAVLAAIRDAIQSERAESAKRWAEVDKFIRATRMQLFGLGILLATIVFMIIASWGLVR